jgi:hypothetical protein
MMKATDKYDIIIQGGQSNAEGCGLGPVSQEYIPCSDILYLNAKKEVGLNEGKMYIKYMENPFTIEQAQEHGMPNSPVGDFSLTFAAEYIKNGLLKDGRKLLIVRAAIGGSGFYKGHWGLQDVAYLKMLEMIEYALSLNPSNRIVAFLWHQGEHDAFEGNTGDVYFGQLTNMLQGVRKRYGTMPFIAGDFVNEWKSKNLSSCEPIVEAIRQVVKNNDKSAFVETMDLESNNQKTKNGDDIHFCRESLHQLGRRYYKAFVEIV